MGMSVSPCKAVFPTSVRVVIPQSYDFHETPGVGCGVAIHVKNEDKPWVGFGGYCPPRPRHALCERSGVVAVFRTPGENKVDMTRV
jgi:hypothetical protein